ncbi:MAG: alpha/beta hydrolase [Alphaproteobacteria bacterium]
MAAKIKRRFVSVGNRAVHYRRAGSGPPIVLIHASPASSRAVIPVMDALSGRHTVFAFDSPGFGETDPLTAEEVNVQKMAAAYAAALDALKMPRCALYGTHTGACIALELAVKFPKKFTGVVLDGVPIFGPEETRDILKNYLPPFRPLWDGSHLPGHWSRMRDQVLWFPWYKRNAAARSDRAFSTPDMLHASIMDFFRSGDAYRKGYGAAFTYNVRAAARALNIPATYMARDDDMLYPHLDLLPKLPRNQVIERHSRHGYVKAQAAAIKRYVRAAKAPADPDLAPIKGRINRRYIDLPSGQVLVRSTGEAQTGRPLFLIHDGRWSSQMYSPLMTALAKKRPVYALDLPGNGDSDAPAKARPGVADFAHDAAAVAARLGLRSYDLYGRHSGASVATALAARYPARVKKLVLDGVIMFSDAERKRLAAKYTPPINVTWDGAYLYTTWLMLRDELVFWPWYARDDKHARAIDANFNASWLHDRVVEVLKSKDTYHLLTQAALKNDVTATLKKLKSATLVVGEEADPLGRYAAKAARLVPQSSHTMVPGGEAARAAVVTKFLDY